VNTEHPITPPTELVQQWGEQFLERPTINGCFIQSYIAAKAAQWGADQELKACLRYAGDNGLSITRMRAARRPKPPSLKEQALTALHAVATGANDTREQHQDLDTIRRALEALDD
jgi:hypothetical protein